MNRLEFMKRLEELLSDISRSEREEALQYYNDYLNDAGVENEQEVLESMGTPEQLARTIKEGLGDNGGDGEFTETGYHNKSYEEAVKNEVVRKEEKKRLSGGMIILLILLCIMALPMLAAMLSSIFGAGIGILGGFLALFVGTAAAGIGLFAAGIGLLIAGMVQMAIVPLVGGCLVGAGILLIGLALFCIWITIWLWGTVFPWIIRTVVNLCRRLLHGRRGEER